MSTPLALFVGMPGYDLSADDFAALEDRWKTWWDRNYDEPPASEEACS